MRLLLIEEDPYQAAELKKSLEAQGYAVEVSLDDIQGEAQARSASYDLIVVGWDPPHLDGCQLVARLRTMGVGNPILLLATPSAIKDRVEGLDAGADDYMTKPYAVAELMARLRVLSRLLPSTGSLLAA